MRFRKPHSWGRKSRPMGCELVYPIKPLQCNTDPHGATHVACNSLSIAHSWLLHLKTEKMARWQGAVSKTDMAERRMANTHAVEHVVL